MPVLRSGKVLQGLNKLETQISKYQNKGRLSVQKVVQPLAGKIPPSSPPNITSYILLCAYIAALHSTLKVWLQRRR